MISLCREMVRYIQNKGPKHTLDTVQQYPPDKVTKLLRRIEFECKFKGYRECKDFILLS